MKHKTATNGQQSHSRQKQPTAPVKVNPSHGLQLEWCFGLNYELSEGVINLTTERRKEVCYTSGHTVVVYDFGARKQRLFQGHANKISAIAYNKTLGILVTADEGDTSMLVVWKAETGTPVRTIFEPEAQGIAAIDISNDGEQLLTLGRVHEDLQRVRVWRWKDVTRDHPIESESVLNLREGRPGRAGFRYIKFNQSDLTEFVATGKDELRFFRIEGKTCGGYSPNSLAKREGAREQSVEFGQTVFLPEEGGNVAVTGTEEGNLVVWDIILIMEEEGNLNHRREVKSINLFGKVNAKNPSVSLLTLHGKYLIVGTSAGTVRFYDFRFRIICWFEDLNLSRITSITFSLTNTPPQGNNTSTSNELSSAQHTKESNGMRGKNSGRPGQSDDKNPSRLQQTTLLNPVNEGEEGLDFPEFIVCDIEARLTLLHKGVFQEIDASRREGQLVLQAIDRKVLCVSSSPRGNKVAIASANLKVYEWILCSDRLRLLKSFRDDGHLGETPTCLAYSPDGEYLVAGTSQTNLYIRQGDLQSFGAAPLLVSQKKKGVRCEMIRFAPDGRYFAVADDLKRVSLFKLGHKYEDPSQPIEWVFAAKIRAHTGPVNDLCFSNNSERLFSVSEDMHMAEYNVLKSKDALHVERLEKIESEDAPVACVPYSLEPSEDMVLVANSGYKLKLWNVVNQQRVCRLSCLGPTFAGPINSLCLISEDMDKIGENGQQKNLRPSQPVMSKSSRAESPKKTETGELFSSDVLAGEKEADRKSKQSRFSDQNEPTEHQEQIVSPQLTELENKQKPTQASSANIKMAEALSRHIDQQNLIENAPPPKYLAFSTKEKMVGVIRLPLDGNPNNSVAVIAHSGRVNCVEATRDGRYLLTAGDNDLSLNVWRVNYSVLASSPLMQGAQETKASLFPSLLEGGATGQLYRDLKDFFYYCQIRRKEENTTKAHKLDGRIPLKEIPNLMIALGHYPSRREIENMQNEVRYARLHDGVLQSDLDLDAFVKLYVNHRPAYGLTREYIADALASVFPKGVVSRKEFLGLLTGYGEKLENDVLEYFFAALMGIQNPGEQLPETFDVNYLVDKVLGFEEVGGQGVTFDAE